MTDAVATEGKTGTTAMTFTVATTPISLSDITVDYAEGGVIEVPQHDGSVLKLRKIRSDYDPTARIRAMNYIAEHQAKGEVVTGLLYVNPEAHDLHEHLTSRR